MTQAGAAPNSEEVFVFPASFAQQRLWFLDQLFPGTSFYNVPTVIRLTGDLNLVALEESFNQIVQRHEVLRTTFGTLEGQPVQIIAPHQRIPLSLIDLQQQCVCDRDAAAQRLITQEIGQPFNLATGPLLRVTLLQLDKTEYVLIINLHHIVFDEWSIALLIRELGLFYTAEYAQKPLPSPVMPIQYADFAHWQRSWLQGEVLESQLSYWRSQLKNLSLLEIQSDRPRPQAQSYRGATQLLELPKDLSQALLALSQQEGVTLFMTLLAAFQTLLYRYTAQTDIAVGSPIANRNRQQLENLIGFFANSLVLRTDLSGNPTFRELLLRVRKIAVEAYAHQDLPFEKLVEELHPERSLSRNPLFQVVFALQNAPMEQLELPGLTLSPYQVETTTTRFDLELYLWECGSNFRNLWGDSWQQSEGLRGVLVYSTDLFEADTIARMAGHFQTLLTGSVANPDTHLADLPLLSYAQEHQLLVEWNQTERDYPNNLCIHQLFEAIAAQKPNAIAVRYADRQFTYQELNNGSNQLGHYLRKMGVGCETLVGVCMEPSPVMVACLLGILKAGGAYIPLDPTYPSERLQFMLEDAGVSILLTQQDFELGTTGEDSQINSLKEQTKSIQNQIPPAPRELNSVASSGFPLKKGDGRGIKGGAKIQNLKVVCLERDWEAIAHYSEENLSNQTTADNLAYVVYTSGSTGTPKGVAVPHRAVNRLVCNTNYITWEPEDKVAQCSNISFDAATFEIWGALLNGAQLIGINRDVILSPQDFAQEIRQQQISVLFLTTALFNSLAREVPSAFSSLRYLLFGGEAVDVRWVKEVHKGAPEHLLHVYGPTENTTFTCWYEVQDVPDRSIPIGRAIANTQIYLLDPHLKPVPIGVIGEIYIGGDGLARGYLNRPDLTNERFISNPFCGKNALVGAGSIEIPIGKQTILKSPPLLYKTGDLARYLPDGNLEFIGRSDDQVKIRGFRIELGEISTVLNQHPAVQEAVVVVREDISGDRRLVAYIVANQEQNLIASELQSFLKTKLPSSMLPAAFVVLESLPLTPNGKVDRQKLPPPDFTTVGLPEIKSFPRTSVEAQLVQIWTEILGQQVGISDNFFELGGHSLLATQLVSRIRDRFGVQMPLRNIFETPTIAALAQYIEAMSGANKKLQADTETIASPNREEVEF